MLVRSDHCGPASATSSCCTRKIPTVWPFSTLKGAVYSIKDNNLYDVDKTFSSVISRQSSCRLQLIFLYRNKKKLYGEFHCIALLFDTILGLFRRLQVQSKMSALWDSSRDVAVNEASKLGQRIA